MCIENTLWFDEDCCQTNKRQDVEARRYKLTNYGARWVCWFECWSVSNSTLVRFVKFVSFQILVKIQQLINILSPNGGEKCLTVIGPTAKAVVYWEFILDRSVWRTEMRAVKANKPIKTSIKQNVIVHWSFLTLSSKENRLKQHI